MKVNARKFIFCSILLCFFIFPLYFSISRIPNKKSGEFSELQISTLYNTQIFIDDLPGSLTNWTWAKDQGYCTGSGTPGDPFVIKNHIFNTSTFPNSPLIVQHTQKHFVIENCFFIGHSSFAGIYLVNVSNGKIRGNSIGFPTGALLYMRNSSYNIISNNIASNGTFYGLLLSGLIGPTRYNTISNNIVSNNTDTGIEVRNGCESNTFSENIISENGNYGITFASGTENNEIYLNCLNNTANAVDNGTNNQWDNGVKGNYWEDYPGVDANDDGIGDTSYGISGSAGTQDNYPLMACPERSSGGGIPGYDIGILISSLLILIISTAYSILKKRNNQILQ